MSRPRSSSSFPSWLPLVLSVLACGPEPLGDSVAATSQAIVQSNPIDLSDELTSATSSTYTNLIDADPRLEVRINKDGSALSSKLIPAVSDGTLSLGSHQIGFGWLPGLGPLFVLQQCHTVDGRTWAVTMKNMRVTPAIAANDVALHFAADKKVEADLDLDDFVMTFELEFLSEHDDNPYCNVFGSDYRASTNVTVTGLSGSLAATVDVPSAGSVRLASIDDLNVEVGTVTLSSDFLNAVAPFGLFLYDLFGPGCGSTINQCVDQQVKEYLKTSDLEAELKTVINDSLGPVAKVEDAVDLGNAKLDYSVALTAVTTSESKDRLRSQWDVDFSTNRVNAACAAGLERANYFSPTNTQTTNDFDILIPYKKLTDLAYTIGKTGDLCAPFSASGATFEVRPNGAFRIDPALFNTFKLSLPVAIEGQLSAFATGSITATLELTAAIEPKCTGVVLRFVGVNLANPVGTATVTIGTQVKTLSAKTFINANKAAVEAQILSMLQPAQVIAPGSLTIPGTGYALQGGQLLWGSNEVTFGFDVVSGACVP